MKGAKSPLRVQSTRIFKLFRKFKNTPSVAKRLFRHAGGGLYIRPKTPSIPAVLPPNVVNRKPGNSGGAARAGIKPPLRTRSKAWRRGGLYGRPGRLAILTAPSPNLVERHAYMPPWPGGGGWRGGFGGCALMGGAIALRGLCFPAKLGHHRTIVSAAFAQSFAPSVQL